MLSPCKIKTASTLQSPGTSFNIIMAETIENATEAAHVLENAVLLWELPIPLSHDQTHSQWCPGVSVMWNSVNPWAEQRVASR